MFAVIFRGRINPEKEGLYQKSWKEIASFFINECGALGSCLHKTDDGLWLAYSRWPSKEHRDNAWPGIDADVELLDNKVKQSFLNLKACVVESFPEIQLNVVEDLLLGSHS